MARWASARGTSDIGGTGRNLSSDVRLGYPGRRINWPGQRRFATRERIYHYPIYSRAVFIRALGNATYRRSSEPEWDVYACHTNTDTGYAIGDQSAFGCPDHGRAHRAACDADWDPAHASAFDSNSRTLVDGHTYTINSHGYSADLATHDAHAWPVADWLQISDKSD